MSYLKEILESKTLSIQQLGEPAELAKQAGQLERKITPLAWSDSLDVIAEIKRRSPSKGELAELNDPAQLGTTYAAAGVAAISVLTDPQYFGARENDFSSVRAAVSTPLLRKDFIIDERQVYETYLMGADIMLLIVAAFDDSGLLRSLHEQASELGLHVLVETHDQHEIERACNIGASIIGVNVRNLSTFDEDPGLGSRMIAEIPKGTIKVWESAIRSLDDAKRARDAGADAVLIGQALVQHENPAHFIEQIRAL